MDLEYVNCFIRAMGEGFTEFSKIENFTSPTISRHINNTVIAPCAVILDIQGDLSGQAVVFFETNCALKIVSDMTETPQTAISPAYYDSVGELFNVVCSKLNRYLDQYGYKHKIQFKKVLNDPKPAQFENKLEGFLLDYNTSHGKVSFFIGLNAISPLDHYLNITLRPRKIKTVLVGDHGTFMTNSLVEVLKRHHIKLDVAKDGSTFVRMLNQIRPAMVFLNLRLIGIKYNILINEIRRLNKHMPIIVFGDFSSRAAAEPALEMGCKFFIEIPCTIHPVIRMIDKYLVI